MRHEVIARITKHVVTAAPKKAPTINMSMAKISTVVHRAFTESDIPIDAKSEISITKRAVGGFSVSVVSAATSVTNRVLMAMQARLTHSFSMTGTIKVSAVLFNNKPRQKFDFNIKLVKQRARGGS